MGFVQEHFENVYIHFVLMHIAH